MRASRAAKGSRSQGGSQQQQSAKKAAMHALPQRSPGGPQGGYLSQLSDVANHSPQVQAQLKLAHDLQGGAKAGSEAGAQPAQMKGKTDKKKPAQMAAKPDKKKPAQRKGKLEEKKPAQRKGKPDKKKPAQMAGKKEKKPAQRKLDSPMQAKGRKEKPAQRKAGKEKKPKQARMQNVTATAQLEEVGHVDSNRTGLPESIKTGVESLSGISLDDVKVHYNSGKPAQLNALAYAQGTDIHIAPGQEKHLPHEAWHIVQQKQGRVQPTTQLQDGAQINDDHALESEADVMGSQSLRAGRENESDSGVAVTLMEESLPAQRKDSEGIIQGYWDVAVKPEKKQDVWIIGNVVIKDRPPNPDTSEHKEEGGPSFHHESAWVLVEKQVTQFEGQSLSAVVAYLTKYGLTGMVFPPMQDPGNDRLDQLAAINNYFHAFLSAKAGEAQGWLGPKGTHASQGGRISAALRQLKKYGFSKQNIHHALSTTFEPGPSIKDGTLHQAAMNHADIFYAAYQYYLEEDPSISELKHEEVNEILKDWDTQYWQEPMDF